MRREGLGVEEWIMVISGALEGGAEVSEDFWVKACDVLVDVGKATWWHCGCGGIDPLSGCVDAFCGGCGEMRRLGDRLSRSPWVLYVHCLRRVYPEDWFDRLLGWCESVGIGALWCEEADAYVEGIASAKSAAYGGAIAAEGEAAYGGAIAAEGVSPCTSLEALKSSGWTERERKIKCVDGMEISSLGYVLGTQWICLSLPKCAELDKI